jgi:polar amino acid transport system substrate-binding protein
MFSTTKSLVAGVLAAGFMFAGGTAFAQTVFDISSEQAGRIHTTPGEAAKLLGDVKLVESGKLTIAMSPYLPPTGFYATDTATVIGANADLASLIAEKLGLEINIVVVAWPDWPLSLESGKFDAFISDLDITEERKKKFDFSSYARNLTGFFVTKESPITEIKEPKDIAGLHIYTPSGTVGEKILLEWNDVNTAAGLAPMEIQYFDDPTVGLLSLQSGRTDVMFVTYSEGAYDAAIHGTTRLVGVVTGDGKGQKGSFGIAIHKGNGLVDPMTAAINELIAEGTYLENLKRWGIESQALTTDDPAKSNPPGLVLH